MKIINNKLIIVITIMAVFLTMNARKLRAQAYKLVPGKEVSIKVLGLSNVHDWTEVTSPL